MQLTNRLTYQLSFVFQLMLVLQALLSLNVTAVNAQENTSALDTLIQEIEQNETLYTSLNLDLKVMYETFPKHTDPDKQIVNETKYAVLLQGRKFRRQRSSQGRYQIAYKSVPRTPMKNSHRRISNSIEVYDGMTHRGLWNSASPSPIIEEEPEYDRRGEISDEIPSLSSLVRPHMFLLDGGWPKAPLSTYLKGTSAIRAYPNPGHFDEKLVIEVQVIGEEEFQGLNCTKIRCETTHLNGTRYSGSELWLAHDRNLIPLRKVSYTYRWSKTIPVAESIVDEWQEVSPGAWFPKKAHTDRYDSLTIKRDARQQLSWRKTYEVKDIDLNPHIPKDAFTKLDFPPETKVTVYRNGKRIE
ncbi:hypothetical protein [Gimesia sp.]|uniref:hypothetical protein n=1 Tax=Gimesia sp. TaxID=2024833 RepID=UPI003A953AA5